MVVLLAREEPLQLHREMLAGGANFRRFLFLSPDLIVDQWGRAQQYESVSMHSVSAFLSSPELESLSVTLRSPPHRVPGRLTRREAQLGGYS